ncbi:uncharacterized protein BX663DRAFT_487668 [Cokeromyces recurvatus]|uniref:uncharacterized protein n=1 Tax=Cokeromyces recurvatus TaxID=90255 RepID=UPI00221F177A|nr:uncharacterized protein BX663DRAFT_487668 [Cokeromyces recurvatus]KAI7901526.1 hypothetical protein BX663DRAFT_487668 [Cokeromyces recurvatus]
MTLLLTERESRGEANLGIVGQVVKVAKVNFCGEECNQFQTFEVDNAFEDSKLYATLSKVVFILSSFFISTLSTVEILVMEDPTGSTKSSSRFNNGIKKKKRKENKIPIVIRLTIDLKYGRWKEASNEHSYFEYITITGSINLTIYFFYLNVAVKKYCKAYCLCDALSILNNKEIIDQC